MTAPHDPRPIVIDTDPGIDDAMAIFYALAAPELDVVGLTTVFGNVDTGLATVNALRLLSIAGRPDIPVARGADRPLAMDFRGPVPYVHGDDGQGNVHRPPADAETLAVSAAQFIVDTVMATPGEVTLVPIGPLTNIALAMLLEPHLTDHVREIVLMGGAAFRGGNASPAAEANIINDPEAADIVFGARCPITMAGLDVTERIVMTGDDLAALSEIDNARARHLASIVPCYADFYRGRIGLDGIHVHDSTAISYLLAPERFGWQEYPIRVDTGASVCRGTTLPARYISDHEERWDGRRPVRILDQVDARAVIELELDHLAR